MRRYRRLALLLGILVTLLGSTACEGARPAPAAQPTWLPVDDPTFLIDPTATLPYRDFPVTAKPRPIVLTTNALADLNHPGKFNPLDAPGLHKRYSFTGSAPKAPAKPVTVHLLDGDVQLHLADFAVMCDWSNVCPADQAGPPATLALGSAWFPTDRGVVRLPAWVLTPEDATHDAVAIPALPPSMFYGGDATSEPPTPQGAVPGPATVSADGRTLHVPVPDTRDACSGQSNPPLPVVIEDGAAIVVASRPDRRVVSKPENCVNSLVGTYIAIDVQLDRPLGNRVVVDRYGYVFPVTPA